MLKLAGSILDPLSYKPTYRGWGWRKLRRNPAQYENSGWLILAHSAHSSFDLVVRITLFFKLKLIKPKPECLYSIYILCAFHLRRNYRLKSLSIDIRILPGTAAKIWWELKSNVRSLRVPQENFRARALSQESTKESVRVLRRVRTCDSRRSLRVPT